MGKLTITISVAMFNGYVSHYQRVGFCQQSIIPKHSGRLRPRHDRATSVGCTEVIEKKHKKASVVVDIFCMHRPMTGIYHIYHIHIHVYIYVYDMPICAYVILYLYVI